MKVLMISLDNSLLDKNPAGDVMIRMGDYAKKIDLLDILVFSSKVASRVVGENLHIIPSKGNNKISQFLNGWKNALKLTKDKDLITCQDSFFTGLIGWLVSRKKKIPFIIDMHGDFFNSKTSFLRSTLAKFLLKRANLVRIVNPEFKNQLKSLGVEEENIHYCPVPVNKDIFTFEYGDFSTPKKIKKEFGGEPLLLYAGRLSYEKGVDILLHSLDRLRNSLPKVKLLILGRGSQKNNLGSFVRTNNLQESVFFVGQVDYDRIKYYYQACDIFILPSREESFGRVILEAAMAEIPIIASKTAGAIHHIKDKENGYLFAVGNSSALAKKIEYVWSVRDSEAKDATRTLNKEIKLKYNYKKDINNLIDLWKKAIKK